MKSIDKYKKQNAVKMDCVQRSINIETKHQEFIEKNNFNLSEMVRDLLDDLMAKFNKSKDKSA